MNNQTDWFSKSMGNVAKYGLMLFILPVMVVASGWLGGVFIKWVFGNEVTYGLNLLFNTNRFEVSDIPWVCSVLAMIGGYFHYKFDANTKTKQDEQVKN